MMDYVWERQFEIGEREKSADGQKGLTVGRAQFPSRLGSEALLRFVWRSLSDTYFFQIFNRNLLVSNCFAQASSWPPNKKTHGKKNGWISWCRQAYLLEWMDKIVGIGLQNLEFGNFLNLGLFLWFLEDHVEPRARGRGALGDKGLSRERKCSRNVAGESKGCNSENRELHDRFNVLLRSVKVVVEVKVYIRGNQE